MEALVCKNCGANVLIKENEHMVCPYCDSRFIVIKEERQNIFSTSYQTILPCNKFSSSCQPSHSYRSVSSPIALDDDIARLLKKCESDPRNARKYANLILDIDPDNEEALKYI